MRKHFKKSLFFLTIIAIFLALALFSSQAEKIKLSTLKGADQVYCTYPVKTPGLFHSTTKCPKLKGDNFNISLKSVLGRDYLPCPDCIEIDADLKIIKARTDEEEEKRLNDLYSTKNKPVSFWSRDTEGQNSWGDELNSSPESLSFSDDLISIIFVIGDKDINFEIQNKTDNGIKIIWDNISLIYKDGRASRVIHKGTRLMDRNNSQVPSMIPPKAKISDLLIPSENITYTAGFWNYWSLFKEENNQSISEKRFRIYFPLEIKGDTKEYTFRFKLVERS